MSGLDLDLMRGRWAEQGARIDAGVRFDVTAMRAALDRRTRSARRRQLVSVAISLLLDAALLLALVVYMIARHDQPSWLLMAIGFAAPLFAHVAAGVTQLRLLRQLDPAGPVAAALDAMARLRALRLRLARMIVLLSVLLWWPMLMLLLNALFGVDLLRWLHWSVVWSSVVAGVVFVPVAWLLMSWLARRYGDRPGMRSFLDDAAGRGWQRLRDGLVASERLASATDADAASALMPRPLPAAASAPLRTLRIRLWAVILAAAIGMLAIGGFNALHGGLWQFIAPGVLLNLVLVAQLAFSIENRVALTRTRRAGVVDADALQAVLPAIAAQRETLARVTLALAPLWGPALVQVVAKVAGGVDLLGGTGPSTLVAIGVGAVVASGALVVLAWRRPARFPAALVAAFSCGIPAAARRVLTALRA